MGGCVYFTLALNFTSVTGPSQRMPSPEGSMVAFEAPAAEPAGAEATEATFIPSGNRICIVVHLHACWLGLGASFIILFRPCHPHK